MAVEPAELYATVSRPAGKEKLYATVEGPSDEPPSTLAQHLLLVVLDDPPLTKGYGTLAGIGPEASGPAPSARTAIFPKTPIIDALVEGGVSFDRCYGAPVCSPTRAHVLTGVHSFRTGIGTVIRDNLGGELSEFADTPKYSYPTIFQRLGEGGIRTGIVGKLHLSIPVTESFDSGSDRSGEFGIGWGILSRLGASFNRTLLRNLNQTDDVGQNTGYYDFSILRDGSNVPVSEDRYNTTVLVDDAITFWNTMPTGKRGFLYLPLNATHSPFGETNFPPSSLVATQEYIDAKATSGFWATYFGAMEAVDKELGRLLSSIPAGIRRRLTVVILADNGADEAPYLDGVVNFGKTYGPDFEASLSTGNAKGSVKQWGGHLQLIWNGPSDVGERQVANPGRRSGVFVNDVDLFATIGEYFGVNVSPNDGESFLDEAWNGGEAWGARRRHTIVELFNRNGDYRTATEKSAVAFRIWLDGRERDESTPANVALRAGTYSLQIDIENGKPDRFELFQQWDGLGAAPVDLHELAPLYSGTVRPTASHSYYYEWLYIENRLTELRTSKLVSATSMPVETATGVKFIPLNDDGHIPVMRGLDEFELISNDDRTHLPVTSGLSSKQIPYQDIAGEAEYALDVVSGKTLKNIPLDGNHLMQVVGVGGKNIPSIEDGGDRVIEVASATGTLKLVLRDA